MRKKLNRDKNEIKNYERARWRNFVHLINLSDTKQKFLGIIKPITKAQPKSRFKLISISF